MSVKKNYFYNLIYQAFLLIIPLAVTPYLSRVFGADVSGRYGFSFSVVTYFTLLASLGFGYYAQRLIASHRQDEGAQARDFWEIVIARSISTAVAILLYVALLLFDVYPKKYRLTLWALTPYILSSGTDIAFYFQGNEQFKKIVLRNMAVRLLGFIGVFLLVKDKGDIWIYALLQGAVAVGSGLALWTELPEHVRAFPRRGLKPWKHILPTMVLFLPTMATTVYTALDKTLLGVITGLDSEIGNYEYAERLVKMAMTLLTALGTVMIPRNAERFSQGDLDGVKENIFQSVRFVLFLGVPLCLGLVAVAGNIVPWYLGAGYQKTSALIKLLSPIILIIGLSNVFGLQFLIPAGRDKQFTVAIVSGALANLVLNLLLIPLLKSYGATIATVVAECVVTLVMFRAIKKEIGGMSVFDGAWRYFLAGVITYLPARAMAFALAPSFLHSLLIAGVGALVYFLCLVAIGEPMITSALDGVKKRLKRS